MAPGAILAPAWQQPYVNVFKLCGVDEDMKEFEVLGDVTDHMDRIIGKKVFKVRGTIPAANFIRLPKSKGHMLGLTGRFVYMQIKVSPVKVFVIHLEVVTQDQNVHRVSISSMYKAEQLRRKSNGIQIPFPRASHRWCVVAMDLAGALARFTSSPFHSLKSVQLCSWVTVRSLFTSDLKFSLQTLPGDLALSHALDSSVFEYVWLPREPSDVQDSDIMPKQRRPMTRDGRPKRPSSSTSSVSTNCQVDDKDKDGVRPPPHSPTTVAAPIPPIFNVSHNAPNFSEQAGVLAAELAQHATTKMMPEGPAATVPAVVQAARPQPGGPVAAAAGGKRFSPRDYDPKLGADQMVADVHGAVLEPDPIITLERVNAYTGEFVRTVAWPPHSDEVVFTAGSVIVAMQSRVPDAPAGNAAAGGFHGSAAPKASPQPRQRFFMGHTAYVVAVAFDAEGTVMASAQDGKHAIIRLWDFRSGQCVAILNGHASGMMAVDVSRDARAVVGVGMDAANRQTMVLWNIAGLRLGGKAEVIVKQPTEFNIKAIKFSAYEEDHLVTAGRDNVRFYRLKAQQLRGVTARLTAPDKRVSAYMGGLSAALGPNVFTDIAFESSVGVYAPETRHVFVSSASGAVFEIDYGTRALLCVYQLHGAAINALVIHDGFAVTGSDDKQLRVWPMDFSDFLLEAEHEAGVTGVGVSPDGLRVAVGTENGALGVLDVPSHAYTTLLRSHTGVVNSVVMDPVRDQYCTVSADGTIRIWDLTTHAQLVEFDAPGERALCAAYHPRHYELAVGFENGRTRVFDVATTTLVQEHMQHKAPVLQVLYSTDGARLYTAGADGGLCVYDVAQVYQPTKFLSAGVRDLKVCAAVSPDGRYLATVSRDPYRAITSLLVFHGSTLDPYMRIETDTPAFKRIAFSPDGMELWAVAEPNRLDRYELFEGQLLQQVSGAHRLDIQSLAVDPAGRFVVTGGNDALVKVWAAAPRSLPRAALQAQVPAHQAFSGHPSAVLGAAIKGQTLITVGDADSVFVWRINAPPSQPPPSSRTLPRTSASSTGAAQQGASATMRQWLPAEPGASMHATPHTPATAQSPTAVAASASGLTGQLSSLTLTPGGAANQAALAAAASPRRHGRAAKDIEVGAAVKTVPPASPGPPEAATATSLTFPAAVPQCGAVVGYTPSGVAQNAVWAPGSGLFAYAVDNVVVIEDLATHTQRFLSHFTQPVSVIAVSADSTLLAAGCASAEPSAFAEVCVWDVASGTRLAALQYHPVAVEALSFSPDNRFLVSVGRDPERSVVVWEVGGLSVTLVSNLPAIPGQPVAVAPPVEGRVVAVGRTRFAVAAAAWLPVTGTDAQSSTDGGVLAEGGVAAYRFVTAGGDGLLLWGLRPSCLEQTPVALGACDTAGSPSQPGASQPAVAATAVTVDGSGLVVVADAGGRVWEVAVQGDGGSVAMRRVADVPGREVTRIAVSGDAAAVGTLGGLVAAYSRGPRGSVWSRGPELHVDGAVSCLCFEAGMTEAVVATSSSTVWYINTEEGWRVPLVASHTAPLTSLTGPGRSADGAPLLASTSADGALRVWHMDAQSEPVAEFQTGVPCTCCVFVGGSALPPSRPPSAPSSPRPASPSMQAGSMKNPDGSSTTGPAGAGLAVVGGYADGSLRLFGARAGQVAQRWAAQRHGAPVVAVTVHPRGGLVLSAASDGALAVTELATSKLTVMLEHFVAGSQQQLLQMPGYDGAAVLAAGAAAQSGQRPAPTNPLCCVDVSPADATLCAAAWRTHLVVFATPWDDSIVRMMALYKCEESVGALSHDVPAIVQFVPRTTKLLAYSSPLLLGKVLVFDYRLASVVHSISVTQMVRSLALSPDGSLAVLGGTGGSVYVAETGVGSWGEPGGATGSGVTPQSVAVAQKGESSQGGSSRKVLRWVELKGHLYPVTCVRFLGGGGGVAGGGAGGLRVVSGAGTSMWVWEGVGSLLAPTPAELRASRIL